MDIDNHQNAKRHHLEPISHDGVDATEQQQQLQSVPGRYEEKPDSNALPTVSSFTSESEQGKQETTEIKIEQKTEDEIEQKKEEGGDQKTIEDGGEKKTEDENEQIVEIENEQRATVVNNEAQSSGGMNDDFDEDENQKV